MWCIPLLLLLLQWFEPSSGCMATPMADQAVTTTTTTPAATTPTTTTPAGAIGRRKRAPVMGCPPQLFNGGLYGVVPPMQSPAQMGGFFQLDRAFPLRDLPQMGPSLKRNNAEYRPFCCQEEQLWLCFSADTQVVRMNSLGIAEWVRIDSLNVGEWIATSAGLESDMLDCKLQVAFTPVTSWIHRVPHQLADFIHIRIDGGVTDLKLTAKHLIYVVRCDDSNNTQPSYVVERTMKRVPAELITVGDCLLVAEGLLFQRSEENSLRSRLITPKRVIEVASVKDYGIYSPMTANAALLAEGVLVSAYTMVANSVLQLAFLSSNIRQSRGESPNGDNVTSPHRLKRDLVNLLTDTIIPSHHMQIHN